MGCRIQLRQTKIQDLGFAASRNEDVCGLYIAMDDALVMRCLQPRANLNSKLDQLVDGHRPAPSSFDRDSLS